LNLPTVDLAIAINEAVREGDEWFEDADDLERLAVALRSADGIVDPVAVAARLAYRVAAAQAFAEGNKRTALLLARWVLDHNDVDGAKVLGQAVSTPS
jgi:prophage maintenance system killer protein